MHPCNFPSFLWLRSPQFAASHSPCFWISFLLSENCVTTALCRIADAIFSLLSLSLPSLCVMPQK